MVIRTSLAQLNVSNLFSSSDVSHSIHLEAIMNIPEWQSKMIRSTPKSIMKHASKQLEALGAISGGNGSFKDELKYAVVKSHLPNEEKKIRKCNIDLLTGKRKYTKKLLKLEGVLTNSKFPLSQSSRMFSLNFHDFFRT